MLFVSERYQNCQNGAVNNQLTTLLLHPDLRISQRIFEKNRNESKALIRGPGEDDLWKKPEAKNLVTLSLSAALSPPPLHFIKHWGGGGRGVRRPSWLLLHITNTALVVYRGFTPTGFYCHLAISKHSNIVLTHSQKTQDHQRTY
jgi:hypothetical protein